MDSIGRPEATRDRTVAECEQLAERNGFRCMVAGYFPDLPLPPVPRFLPPSYAPPPRRVADRLRLLDPPSREGEP